MSTKESSLVPDVIALRPFVPAKDFETSLRFFADLGFRAHRLGDLLASMHIGPFAFLLQGRPNDDERFAAATAVRFRGCHTTPQCRRPSLLDYCREVLLVGCGFDPAVSAANRSAFAP
jgi:hypothetical protein